MLEPLSDDDPRAVGRFTLEGRLGAGAMGRVYLGRAADGTEAAIKVVRRELADDPEFRARFRHEVAAVARVLGNHTAVLVDADTDAAQPWLATEYLPGPSLREVVRDRGPLPVGEVLRIAGGVADALVVIHAAGLVHRDLKPGNVLLAADGPRVIDFGIARATDVTSLTATGISIGTPTYMAPEHIGGAEAGPPADVFALGGLIVFLATGRSPFGDGPSSAVLYRIAHTEPNLDGLPEPLLGLARSCLDRDPARRPAPATLAETCARLLAAIEPPEPATTRIAPAVHLPAPPEPATMHIARRRRRRIGVLIAAVLLVVAGVTVPLLVNRSPADPPDSAAGDAPPESGTRCAGTRNLRAAGSFRMNAAARRLATAYARTCTDHRVDYQPLNREEVLSGFETGTYPMALLDEELTGAERADVANGCAGKGETVLVPLVLNPIALPYTLAGVDRLVLDAPTIAQIFELTILEWDDPKIAALNPGTPLPDLRISVITRMDPAESTDVFQSYLVRAAPDVWGERGAGKTFGSLGSYRQDGENGVVSAVAATNGAIGYATYVDVWSRNLPVAEIAPSADPAKASQLTAANIASAATSALPAAGADLSKLQDGIYGATAYPLVGVHHLLACRDYADPATAAAVRDFLHAAVSITEPVSPPASFVLPSEEFADRVADIAETIR